MNTLSEPPSAPAYAPAPTSELATSSPLAGPFDALPELRGVVVGQVLSRDPDGRIWLVLPVGSGAPVCAQFALCDPRELSPGRRVAVLFQEERTDFPVVVGPVVAESPAPAGTGNPKPARLALEATHEITLRCGKSSLQLLADGSVLIRGAYVLSRASGINRIRGGNVQIN